MVDRNEALREMARRELARRQGGGAAAPRDKSYTGSFLPFSRNDEGEVSFDSNAGILGALKDAFMLPGDAMAGKVDPTSQEGIERAFNFAGAVSPINPMARSGERVVPGVAKSMRRANVEPPSAAQLREAADTGYETARNMDVAYSSQSVADMARRVQSDLEAQGVIDELAPKSFATLKRLQNPPEDSVATISGVDAARRVFGNIGQEFANPTDQLAAGSAKRAVDDFLGGPPAGSVLPESAQAAEEAARTIVDARGNYAASRRSGALAGIEESADLRAAAANSGQNSGNALRQRIASLILNPKASAGFTDRETALLEKIVKGSRTANATRYVGNLLGGGGGMGAAVTGGIAGTAAAMGTGNPAMAAAGLVAPVMGAASKKVSNRLTAKALEKVDAETRRRSPLYEEMVRQAPMEGVSPDRTAALMRLIMLGGNSQAGGGGGW